VSSILLPEGGEKNKVDVKIILKKIKLAESTISTFLGVFVVIVVGILIFKYFQGLGKPGIPPESIPEVKFEEKEEKLQPTKLPSTHTVQKGEHLWKIALKYYDSGYNWVDIAKENNIKNPNLILPGTELKIPEAPKRIPVSFKEKATLSPIDSGSYLVVKGDNLWNIAVRAYGDGYRCLEIAKANKLANPNLIHPGNNLVIPR